MAVYDLEEQEQLSNIKAWWETWGNLITGIALAVAVSVAGWQGWQWYQNRQSAAAGQLYYALQQAVSDKDASRARSAVGQLIAEYGRTSYAQLGALSAAALQFSEGDLDNARAQLQWAVDNGRDAALRELARLRLASVLLESGDPDAALAQLDAAAPSPQLAARHALLRGDVQVARQAPEQAAEAYRQALEALRGSASQSALVGVVELKLASLGG